MKIVEGSINAPKGFKSGGKFIGLKKNNKDLAIVTSEVPCRFAAAFTTNKVKAAPILWNKDVYENYSDVKALVVNSGFANACTGKKGYDDVQTMASTLAKSIGSSEKEVLVASTGVIGVPLPIDKIEKGIVELVPELDGDIASGVSAAEGITTTDTSIKTICVELELDGKQVHIGGMAKGSGMIHPNMATMLSFITTDVNIQKGLLRDSLREIVEDTFNMITVDGDTSTNDMVITMANGMAENAEIDSKSHSDYEEFYKALYYVNEYLAKQIVRDGEGASKFIEVQVDGAKSEKDAKLIVKSILNSNLVKTALFGEDGNWGRIICAAGYSGAEFDPDKVSLYFVGDRETALVFTDGTSVDCDEDAVEAILKNSDVKMKLILKEGEASSTGWGCDLSYDYIKINGEYRT